jgi:hypothetical protein
MKTKIAILLLAIILTACAPAITPAPTATSIPTALPPTPSATATQESTQNQVGDECIPPEAEWEYPIKPPDGSGGQPLSVPPPAAWIIQTSLTEISPKAKLETLELIEHQPGYDVIWVTSGDKFLRFRTDTKQWSSVSLNNDLNMSPRSLFQDPNGRVWAYGYYPAHPTYFTRFLRLNDNDQFEFADNGGIQGEEPVLIGPPLVSKDSTFWILVSGKDGMALYSFDPNTRKAKRHLAGGLGEFGLSIAMGLDGSVFLVRPNEKQVVRYYPDSGLSDTIVVYYRFEGDLTDNHYPDLFVDRSGNLWIGDYVWIDFKHLTAEGGYTWHQIIRSPLFISKYGNLRAIYLWMRPRPMLQSVDGRIWFRGFAAGLVWLDPQKGLWCKFTTIDSNILEDRDGNLWLLYDSNLYKYSITPQ